MNEYNKNLAEEIRAFKEKIKSKNEMIVFEPNRFDLFIDDIFNIISSKYKKIDKFFVKSLLVKSGLFLKNNLIFFRGSLKKIFGSINSLEKKIEAQQELLLKMIEFNKELSIKLNKFDEKINSVIIEYSQNQKYHSNLEIENRRNHSFLNEKNENTKLNIIQEENLRISNELFESRQKINIMMQELEKYHKQRTDLINKINSANEIMKDSNVLISVFDNSLTNQKIRVLDPEKPIVKNLNEYQLDLEEKVKQIFIKK